MHHDVKIILRQENFKNSLVFKRKYDKNRKIKNEAFNMIRSL